MDARITNVTLVVKNQAEALEFYTKKVGFEKKTDVTSPEGYRWVTVGPKGQDIELTLQQGTTGNNPGIVMRVDDCRKYSGELKSRGVQFKQEPLEHPFGVTAIFTDPDGNLFQVNQLP